MRPVKFPAAARLVVALVACGAFADAAHAVPRCTDRTRELASSLAVEARAVADPLERSLMLKRSLTVCAGYRAWVDLGRAELELGSFADAAYAFENARDHHASGAELGRAEIAQRALGNAWLAESYRLDGRLALASVAVQEARRGFDAAGRAAPGRLLALQAAIDDELAEADASVLARSFEVQHERATRGIGVRARVRPGEDSPETARETAEALAEYAGAEPGDDASVVSGDGSDTAAVADTDTPPTSPPAVGTTESRMNIPVLFDFDSAELAPSSDATVERLADAIRRLGLDGSATVRVIGHTDVRGPAGYNLALSERRAATVLERIRRDSGTAARLEALGRGEAEPRYAGDGADDHRRNRRVEVVVSR